MREYKIQYNTRRYPGNLYPAVTFTWTWIETPGAPWGDTITPQWDPRCSGFVRKDKSWAKVFPPTRAELVAAVVQYILCMELDYRLRGERGLETDDRNRDVPITAEAKAIQPAYPRCRTSEPTPVGV